MKWQAIANITGQINEEAKSYLINKLTKDASVEAPNLWSDLISSTTKHLRDSQSHMEVTTDEKTGSLTCLTNFDPMHEDFLEHGKNFARYALSKYDGRASSILSQTKNPFTRRFLEQRIGNYRMQLAENLAATEVKLIDGKRHSLAIDAIDKLKNATYDNPHLYSQNLEDGISAIASLSLLPTEKEQLMHSAREELAYAAGLSTLRRSPQSLLITDEATIAAAAPWRAHLSFEQRVRLENKARHVLEQTSVIREKQIKTLAEINFDNILETGEECKGFSHLVNASYAASDPRRIYLEQKTALYKQAFVISDQVKTLPFDKGDELLQTLDPAQSNHSINKNTQEYEAQKELYAILLDKQEKEIKAASVDPAKYIDEKYTTELEDLDFSKRLEYRKILQEQKGIPSHKQRYLTNKERISFEDKLVGAATDNNLHNLTNELDTILEIGRKSANSSIGIDLLQEILQEQNSLNIPLYFYAKNYALKDVSKSAEELSNSFAQIASVNSNLEAHKLNNQNKQFESELKQAIDDNKTFKNWHNDFVRHRPYTIKEAAITKEGITTLARYYNLSKGLNAKDAANQAISEVITGSYFSPIENLQIPKTITANNKVIPLNEDYIKSGLMANRLKLLRLDKTLEFDYHATLGVEKGAEDRLDEIDRNQILNYLALGEFVLTPDQRRVYYIFPTQNDNELPKMQAIMKNKDEVLLFDLNDLNTRQSNDLLINENNKQFYETLNKLPYHR